MTEQTAARKLSAAALEARVASITATGPTGRDAQQFQQARALQRGPQLQQDQQLSFFFRIDESLSEHVRTVLGSLLEDSAGVACRQSGLPSTTAGAQSRN